MDEPNGCACEALRKARIGETGANKTQGEVHSKWDAAVSEEQRQHSDTGVPSKRVCRLFNLQGTRAIQEYRPGSGSHDCVWFRTIKSASSNGELTGLGSGRRGPIVPIWGNIVTELRGSLLEFNAFTTRDT